MTNDRLPTEFTVMAQMRTTALEGVPLMIRRRGDRTSGVIVLKINRLDGTARVLTQVCYGDEYVWTPVSSNDPMPDSDAEKYLERQLDIDPDSWILEIEDKQGRHWFPGKVVNL